MSTTPRRVVALSLIAITIAGLILAHVHRDPDRVSVPRGAVAGQIDLEPCTYEADNATLRAECGTLTVPENRGDPDSRLIALPVTRVLARTGDPAEPLFRLEGGPGLSNMEFPAADRFAGDRDVVLVGYRGVDGSARLDCPEVADAMKVPRDLLGADARSAVRAGFADCSERLQDEGYDLAGYTLPQRVADIEYARRALGYDRIDLVSESAGSRTALIYAWRHPDRVHRSVMVAPNPPGRFLWDGTTTDAQIERYSDLCAADGACSERTGDLAATMERIGADVPDRWLLFPVHAGNVRVGSFFGMNEATEAPGPLNAPMTVDAWQAADDADASGLWMLSLMANLLVAESQVWGDVAAIGRADLSAARRYFASGAGDDPSLGAAASSFLMGRGDLFEAWPANPDDDAFSRMRTSPAETLLISGELDFAAPPRNSRELLEHLPNGRRVVLDGLGHSGDFWGNQVEAGTRLIETYLDSGRVDTSLYRRNEVDFTPSASHATIAKGLAGGLVGLPLVVALALAGFAGRIRRKGRLRPRPSAVVRSLFAAVAGLAGWMLAVAVDLTVSAGVPIDDPSLVMVAVAIPVAASVYYGWLDRGRPRRTRMVGLGGAVTGAVIGAKLGGAAATGLIAMLAAIAGAVAGANLALVARDIWAGEAPAGAAAPDPVAERQPEFV